MSFEVEGKLHKTFPAESKSETFRTREFVIETLQGSFSQFVKFQLVQEKCDMIDQFKEGQQVKVYFDLRGRQWQDKYFTNLQAWRVEAVGETQPAPMPESRETADVTAGEGQADTAGGDSDFDDLPF